MSKKDEEHKFPAIIDLLKNGSAYQRWTLYIFLIEMFHHPIPKKHLFVDPRYILSNVDVIEMKSMFTFCL